MPRPVTIWQSNAIRPKASHSPVTWKILLYLAIHRFSSSTIRHQTRPRWEITVVPQKICLIWKVCLWLCPEPDCRGQPWVCTTYLQTVPNQDLISQTDNSPDIWSNDGVGGKRKCVELGLEREGKRGVYGQGKRYFKEGKRRDTSNGEFWRWWGKERTRSLGKE